jgi:phosphatidate cytidylyltransferase
MTTTTDAQERSAGSPKAGRNLPAALGVGMLLAAVVVASLFTQRWAFVALTALAVAMAILEVGAALSPGTPALERFPLAVGGAVVVVATYVRGSAALVIATLLLVAAVAVWSTLRAASRSSDAVRLCVSEIFIACYVPFLAGFAVLLAIPDDGPRRAVTFIATVVCADTGGYAVGSVFGRHRMAPKVSPKKSWEGFAGSVLTCAVCAGVLVPLLLHGRWWQGVVLGLAVVVAATLGDLGESMLKRDLGIKDMGRLLPGHGGVMDRLDSLLVAAPVAWALLTAFVPWPN